MGILENDATKRETSTDFFLVLDFLIFIYYGGRVEVAIIGLLIRLFMKKTHTRNQSLMQRNRFYSPICDIVTNTNIAGPSLITV